MLLFVNILLTKVHGFGAASVVFDGVAVGVAAPAVAAAADGGGLLLRFGSRAVLSTELSTDAWWRLQLLLFVAAPSRR